MAFLSLCSCKMLPSNLLSEVLSSESIKIPRVLTNSQDLLFRSHSRICGPATKNWNIYGETKIHHINFKEVSNVLEAFSLDDDKKLFSLAMLSKNEDFIEVDFNAAFRGGEARDVE